MVELPPLRYVVNSWHGCMRSRGAGARAGSAPINQSAAPMIEVAVPASWGQRISGNDCDRMLILDRDRVSANFNSRTEQLDSAKIPLSFFKIFEKSNHSDTSC
ncbi:hypothetical protein EVAR_10427_1 [Eumeta japonica]|uniref:Uncharacterized protein n=1 Tax=Eumeta variegata TaxID=151549 RepID=A0A4C1UDJ8_EUMVA|nr:hypothetical protein EVAR_10427_1 [Eumeta japonica]